MIKVKNIRIYLAFEFTDLDQLNQFRDEVTRAMDEVLPDRPRAVNFTYTDDTGTLKTIKDIKKQNNSSYGTKRRNYKNGNRRRGYGQLQKRHLHQRNTKGRF